MQKKGNLSEEAKKRQAKVEKIYRKMLNDKKELSKSENRTWQLIADLTDNGYSMNSEKTRRIVNQGQVTAAYFVGGIIPAVAIARTGEGNKYKVKKTKQGQEPTATMEVSYQNPGHVTTRTTKVKAKQWY